MKTRTRAGRAWSSIAAFALLLLVSPVVVVSAAISALTYRAWPFFVHERVGRGGHPIRVAKIRTLPPQTAVYVSKYSLRSVDVARHMRLMRRLHIDELPQLWQVVIGDMAFVGPRPEMQVLHAQLATDFADFRTSVEPGLTGLWQISPHNAGLIGERPEYDRLYIEHRSARLDRWIMARTVRKMLFGTTTHLYEVPVHTLENLPGASESTHNLPEPAKIVS